jgi:peptide/nickel transport system permease protein
MSDQGVPATEAAVAPGRQRIRRGVTLQQAVSFRRTQLGLAIVLVLVCIAIFGPLVAPHSPTAFVDAPYAGPSSRASLGADYLGRDVLSRFLSGGRSVLGLALAATALGVAVGVAIGLIAAYMGSWLDDVLMRSGDVFMAFPPVIFALLVVSTVGPKIWLLVLTVAVIHAPRVARLVRGAALEVVGRDFIKAAEALGEKRRRILLVEILPNINSPLLVETSLRLTFSIALVASLSFLGFGLQPPAADWGLMISENRNGLAVQPWPVVLPVVAISLLTIGTNLIADGLSRALIGVERVVRP